MPFRAWLFIAAFGLAFSALNVGSQMRPNPTLERQPETESGQADGNGASPENASPEDQRAPDLTPALKGIETAIHDLMPTVNEGAGKQQTERDNADLDAQQSMAFWAFWMFVATFGTVVVTFIGIVLIWRTLHHTRRAADYAREMVDEAKEATKATRAILMAERAFMVYDSFQPAGYDDPASGVSHGLVFEIFIRNVGRSPAREFKITTKKFVLGSDFIPTRLTAPLFSKEHDAAGLCGSGQSMVTALHSFSWAEIESHFSGASRLFICGFGVYSDVFEQEQELEFCAEIHFKVTIDLLKNPGSRPVDQTIYLGFVGPNNRYT